MQEIAKALTWTFIHSLWQGLLAALVAAIIIASTRNATARLRYNLLGIVMILFFTGSVITFITQWHVEAKPIAISSAVILDDVPVINKAVGTIDNFMDWVNTNSATIVVIWTFFFLFSCLRLATGLAAVNRLRHYKTQPITAEWKNKLEQLQIVVGVRCSVSLLQSKLVKVPMALGILKPVILLPLGLITHLPPEQVETILLHELAHIRRRDYFVNLLQHIAEAIFFFNPAVRWISSLIRQEREASCDDIVVANCQQKTNYLNALINFQEYSFNHNTPYAMGIGSKRHYLLNRVRRIINNKNKGINLFEKAGLLAGVLLFSAFCFVTKKPAIEPVKPGSYSLQQPAEKILPIVLNQPQHHTIKKGKAKLLNKPVADTIPKKTDTAGTIKNIDGNKLVIKPGNPEQAAKATLQEIIKIKTQIGIKKESIGVLKEQLKTKEGPEKEKIQKDLQLQRRELDKQREQLDIKREQWDYLKEKAKEKQVEEKHGDAKKIVSPGNSATIKKNDANQLKKIIQYEKSAEWDKSDQWDKSDRWDEHDRKKLDVNNKIEEQEFQYKMNLPLKDPPPAKQVAPENSKKPGTPAKKVQPAGPDTGN